MQANKYPAISDKRTWSAGVSFLKKNDKTMRKIIERLGGEDTWAISMKYLEKDHYVSLVSSIIYQQISTSAGDSILRRLRKAYNGRMPSPKVFLGAKEKKIREAGVSPQKYRYLKDLCQRIENGRLEPGRFYKMDNEDIINELDEVKGIGRWTAEMYLIRTLGRADVLPVDDLGLRKAIQSAYHLQEQPKKERILRIAQRWRPYRTIATIFLWRSMNP